MDITEVHVHLPKPDDHPNVLAYVGIVLEGEFALHDLKVIRGEFGPMLCMPSRLVMDSCPDCKAKNPLRSRYCGMCGRKLPDKRTLGYEAPNGKVRTRMDVFHPLNNDARLWMQGLIMERYEEVMGQVRMSG